MIIYNKDNAEGQSLQGVLNSYGIITEYTDGIQTPQEFRFNFSGGWYSDTQIKKIMQFLKNDGGYGYELNSGGGFTITRPRTHRQFVSVGDCAGSIKNAILKENDGKQKGFLCFGQGQRAFILSNLDECAHILIAGSTGSGKSVLLNSLIMELLCFSSANLILIDPKSGAEFGLYEQDTHRRIVSVAKTTREALHWLFVGVKEMEKRYKEMQRKGLKKYRGNKLVIIIDELADLMLTSKKEVEEYIVRIAQKGRAAGVHLIVATQDPRASVVTGLIKYNLPTKVCLKTANARHSINVIDCGRGAELLNKGDCLVRLATSPALLRAQAPFITDAEILACITGKHDKKATV